MCCGGEEGGAGWVRLPAPPRPKPIFWGWIGAGSWRVKDGIAAVVVLEEIEVWRWLTLDEVVPGRVETLVCRQCLS